MLLLATAGAQAADLYGARTIVTGQGEEGRREGFMRCLEEVLIKVSGDARLAGDPAVAALPAADYVRDFSYRDRLEGMPVHDEQGTYDRPYDLTVHFVPERIDAALRSLGRAPWTDGRQRLAVLLAVETPAARFVLAADGSEGAGMAAAIARAAEQSGMSAVLPSAVLLAAAGLDFDALRAAEPPQLAQAAAELGAALPLAGTLRWNEGEPGWVVEWRLPQAGTVHAWRARAGSFDQAFRDGLRGAAQILSGYGEPAPTP